MSMDNVKMTGENLLALAIDENQKPDWDAAERYLRGLSEGTLEAALWDANVDYDPDDGPPHDQALTRLNECRALYEAGSAYKFFIRGVYVWILGEQTGEDCPDDWYSVVFIRNVGAAEAAGFAICV